MAMGGMMALMMLLAQGGASDVLDLVDSASYWKAQDVERTVAALTAQLDAKDVVGARAASVRNLMAIRALGELKDKAALERLKRLVNDPAPFVSDYAKQAIASIEGVAYRRAPVSPEKMKSDLALLPTGCAAVLQTSVSGGAPVSYDKVFEAMKATIPQGDQAELDRMREKITEQLIRLTDATGNFRIEGVTVGVAGDIGDHSGFVVVIGRGLYDAAAMREALEANTRQDPERVEDVEVYFLDRNAALACPSNDRFILIAGPNREVLPVQQVLAALKTGKGGIDSDADMNALLASVDRTKRLWAAMKVTEAYREAEVLEPFDTLTLTGEEKDGQTLLTIVARGKDADAVKAAVDTFEKGRQEALDQMKEAPDEVKAMMQNIVDLVESVKTRIDGAQVTLTAAFKGGSVEGLMLPYFGVQRSRPAMRQEVRPAPME